MSGSTATCLPSRKLSKLDEPSIYIYLYNKDSALNNLQVLICHKTEPTNRPTKFTFLTFRNYWKLSFPFYSLVNLKFCNILIRTSLCHMTEAVKAMEKASAVVSSIVVVGALTHCTLLYSVWDFKSHRWKLMLYELYELEPSHNVAKES